MIRTYTSKRRRQAGALSHVGDLRLSAKQITGTGVVEPSLGFLYCNGVAVSRATYKRLFDLIGTVFGAGDGSTTFNLPDFRGRFMAGITDGSVAAIKISALVRGGILGAEAIVIGKTNVPPHTHAVGTLNVGASGDHTHGLSSISGSVNNVGSNDFAFWGQQVGGDTKTFDGGSITSVAHAHPNGEWSGATDNGGFANTAHQNVHSHQAIGGVLVAY